MGEQLENAATRFFAERWAATFHLEHMDAAIEELAAPRFQLHHRERLAAGISPDDRDGLLAERRAVSEVAGPLDLVTSEVMAVRGDRLALIRTVMSNELGDELSVVTIFGLDANLNRLELMVRFDASAGSDAFAELDRLHAEIGSTGD